MLEAVTKDLVFTISLKRSTQNLQLSTSWAGRLHHLFVTLGSPLGVRMFKSILPARGAMPTPPIGSWFNARHRDDFVTLGRAIIEQSIGFQGVQDNTEIVGDDPDRHSIAQYLSSPGVAKMIYQHL